MVSKRQRHYNKCFGSRLLVTESSISHHIGRIPCSDRNGMCEHTCVLEGGLAKCVCRFGYRLHANGYSCSGNFKIIVVNNWTKYN